MSGEARRSFPCFGGTVSVCVGGPGGGHGAAEAAVLAEARLLDAHRRLSRFLPESELSLLNGDRHETVPVSPLLLELVAASRRAGELSEGLVDATLLDEIERAGYRHSLAGQATAPLTPPGVAPDFIPRPAAPSPARGWSRLSFDRGAGTVSRPPGLGIDSGGIAKGLLADLLAATLAEHPSFAVDCCGDVRIGGRGGRPRTVLVEDPDGGEPLHELAVAGGGVATSGVARRRWHDRDGNLAHHLLDPASGRPAFTGVAQATALAPSAFLAEVRAKQALLSGRELAAAQLPDGGVLLYDDGTVEVVAAEPARQAAAVAA